MEVSINLRDSPVFGVKNPVKSGLFMGWWMKTKRCKWTINIVRT